MAADAIERLPWLIGDVRPAGRRLAMEEGNRRGIPALNRPADDLTIFLAAGSGWVLQHPHREVSDRLEAEAGIERPAWLAVRWKRCTPRQNASNE
jgi:hypothetical protein